MTGCAWCKGPIDVGARVDSVFCSKRCRQLAWRLRKRRSELEARPARARRPLRMAYADPPFPGMARKYYGREASFAGEVDHRALLAELARFDGWALSTSADALRALLPLCPYGARVCAWIKPARHSRRTYGLHNAWEPLIVVPGRRLRPAKCDWLYAGPGRVRGCKLVGRKPIEFCAWMFSALGLLAGDELVDLFPGSGVVARAWAEVQRVARELDVTGRAKASADALPPIRRAAGGADTCRAEDLGDTGRAPAASDASRLGRRRRVPLGAAADL